MSDIFHTIGKIYKLLLSNWKRFIMIGFLGGILGIGFAFLQKPEYKANLSFMLNENENGISSSLSSLAGLAGLSGSSSGSISDDKILFMSNSRNILGSTLLTSKNINGYNELLANHFIDFNNMQKSFASDTALIGFTHFNHTTLKELNYQENKVLDKIIKIIIDDKLLIVTSKKKSGLVAQSAGIILIEFTSSSEIFSKLFTEELYDRLSNYYINKTIQRQLKNYTLIKERADSLKGLVENTEEIGADFFDRNANVVKMRSRIQSERIRKNVEILNLMYAEVLKNLEIAKFALENQTPSFQIIDTPTYPLEIKKLSKLKTGIISSFLFVFLFLISIVLRKVYDKNSPAINT